MHSDTGPSRAPTPGQPASPEEKPGWAAAGLITTCFFVAVNWGGTSGWWHALWIPLLVLSLLCSGYEWTVLVKARFRMEWSEWPTMIGTHSALLAGIAIALGLLRL